MSREVTLAGYVVLAAAMGLLQLVAMRARNRHGHRQRRPFTFGELVVAVVGRSQIRWPLLAGWLWLGWHLFARVDWR